MQLEGLLHGPHKKTDTSLQHRATQRRTHPSSVTRPHGTTRLPGRVKRRVEQQTTPTPQGLQGWNPYVCPLLRGSSRSWNAACSQQRRSGCCRPYHHRIRHHSLSKARQRPPRSWLPPIRWSRFLRPSSPSSCLRALFTPRLRPRPCPHHHRKRRLARPSISPPQDWERRSTRLSRGRRQA